MQILYENIYMVPSITLVLYYYEGQREKIIVEGLISDYIINQIAKLKKK